MPQHSNSSWETIVRQGCAVYTRPGFSTIDESDVWALGTDQNLWLGILLLATMQSIPYPAGCLGSEQVYWSDGVYVGDTCLSEDEPSVEVVLPVFHLARLMMTLALFSLLSKLNSLSYRWLQRFFAVVDTRLLFVCPLVFIIHDQCLGLSICS